MDEDKIIEIAEKHMYSWYRCVMRRELLNFAEALIDEYRREESADREVHSGDQSAV